MNRKSFLILMVALLVLGGAGFALFWKDLGSWGGGDAKLGSKVFEKLTVNDVAQIRLVDGKGEVTLAIKDKHWVVRQRNDYPANYQEISDLLVKLPDLKVVQTEAVGPSLLPRLNLVAPVKDGKDVDQMGTQLELSDAAGKPIASLLLGKKVIKTEDSPLPIKPKKDVGRYVLVPGNATVLVTSDALSSAEARPEAWVARDFFKVERVKLLSSSGEGATWKIARSEEYGQWKFADGGDGLSSGAAGAVATGLTALTPADVAPSVKAESLEKPRTFVAETFDGLIYTIRIAKKPDTDDYYLRYSIAGEPHAQRPPEKGEKPEEKAKRDKEFEEDLKRLQARLALEKVRSDWTYVVAAKTLEPLLKERSDLAPPRGKPGAPGK